MNANFGAFYNSIIFKMKCISFGVFFIFSMLLSAQSSPLETVHAVFSALNSADNTALDTLLTDDFRMASISEGATEVSYASRSDLLSGISRLMPDQVFEKIWEYKIELDGNMASAWLPYSLYSQGSFVHCGTNHIVLHKVGNTWKINQLTDTRKSKCAFEILRNEMDAWLNDWHKAAATADEDVFFGKMSVTGFYLGTDASEKWYSGELKEWSKKYFDTESAWSFTATEREWFFNNDQDIAWFDEILDTWMGACRGTGVLSKENGEWKLQQYNLAMLVPNDIVKEYLKLIEK